MGMEDVLRIDKILDFCDVPQLFVARDAFDTLYLCLLYDDDRPFHIILMDHVFVKNLITLKKTLFSFLLLIVFLKK